MTELKPCPLNQDERYPIKESTIRLEVPGAWSDTVTRTVKTRFYNGHHFDGKTLSRLCYLAGGPDEARKLAGSLMQERVWGKLHTLEEVPEWEPPFFEACGEEYINGKRAL